MNEGSPLIIYEENTPRVRHDLKDGRVDYMELTHWYFLDKFFGFLVATKFFEWCASSYPSPRVKEEIPVWFLLACVMQMKLHTTAAFHRLPGILRAGSILTRLRFNVGMAEGGFNHKNRRPRRVPVDQDTVRKFYKHTDVDELVGWHNEDVVGWYRRHRAFERAGLFILDQTLIPVPDNENYEGVAYLPLDDDGNYVDVEKLGARERARFKHTPCYALTSLLHLNPAADYFLYAAVHVGPGNESGLKVGMGLVDKFVGHFGKGVIKLLIADRGFVDGEMITHFKRDHNIDTLVPLKSNMEALADAIGLARFPETGWEGYSEQRDEAGKICKREEVTAFGRIESWDACDVPLSVSLMRTTTYPEREQSYWGIVCTKSFPRAGQAFDIYQRRTQIEERHRQLKGCWLLGRFTSTAFSLVATHIVFSLLVYSLLQLYLKRKHLQRLANKTITTLQHEEELGKDAVIIYSKRYFGIFDLDDYTDIIVDLEEPARRRLSKWVKAFKRRKIRAPP